MMSALLASSPQIVKYIDNTRRNNSTSDLAGAVKPGIEHVSKMKSQPLDGFLVETGMRPTSQPFVHTALTRFCSFHGSPLKCLFLRSIVVLPRAVGYSPPID